MKKFIVTITFVNRNNNTLGVWAENEEAAKALALKWWGRPTVYASLTAEEERA